MLNASQLEQMRQTNIESVDKAQLVDINTVQVDAFAPIEERATAFLEQIKNPYAFRVGKVAVKVEFTKDGKTLTEAVSSYLIAIKNQG